MTDKKVNAEGQVQRMQQLMNYGLNENKQPQYSSVEYSKVAADGKLYGIIREGAKYYIKVAKNASGSPVADNFDYIGGFMNRKDNMFESFASASRFFDEKMMCINESVDDKQKRVIAESWDLDAKKEVVEEGTRKMQAEISRQRQIMRNAQNITEGKTQQCDMVGGCPKADTLETKEPSSKPGAPFTEVLKNEDVKDIEDTGAKTQGKENIKDKKKPVKGGKKATNESAETPLVSRKNPDYMDTTHGTEIGSNAPFVDAVQDKPEGAVADDKGGESVNEPELEKVNEEVVMHDSQNQNSPEVGVGEKGDNAPFEDKVDITEDVDDLDDTIEDDEVVDDLDVDADENELDDTEVEGEEVLADGDVDVDAEEGADDEGENEFELEVDDDDDTTEQRLSSLEDKMDQILNAINDLKYDDEEDLYNDEDETDDNENDDEQDGPIEDDEEEEIEVVESRSYKAMMSRLNEESDFGKHPAFQKKVMTTPPNTMAEPNGEYDMNDSSVESERPYATSKGSQAPYSERAEHIEDAITEAVMRVLKKKLA